MTSPDQNEHILFILLIRELVFRDCRESPKLVYSCLHRQGQHKEANLLVPAEDHSLNKLGAHTEKARLSQSKAGKRSMVYNPSPLSMELQTQSRTSRHSKTPQGFRPS